MASFSLRMWMTGTRQGEKPHDFVVWGIRSSAPVNAVVLVASPGPPPTIGGSGRNYCAPVQSAAKLRDGSETPSQYCSAQHCRPRQYESKDGMAIRLSTSGSCLFRCAPRAAHRERRRLLPISLFKFAYFLLDTRNYVSPCLREAIAVGLQRRVCLTEKSLVKIGASSRTTRFASKRGEFSPNGSQSGYSARVV